MLQDKSFLPVLVQAKDYRKGDSWLSILTRTIGLSTTWSELELFQALENAALLRNRYLNESCDIVVQPKCLICVDGIDEASSWSFWKERIEETQVYEGIFPNVKFVFYQDHMYFLDIVIWITENVFIHYQVVEMCL